MTCPSSRKMVKWLLGPGESALSCCVGLTFGAFGIVVSRVPEYRVQLQDWINERGGAAWSSSRR